MNLMLGLTYASVLAICPCDIQPKGTYPVSRVIDGQTLEVRVKEKRAEVGFTRLGRHRMKGGYHGPDETRRDEQDPTCTAVVHG